MRREYSVSVPHPIQQRQSIAHTLIPATVNGTLSEISVIESLTMFRTIGNLTM
jgi:hypothetical protein